MTRPYTRGADLVELVIAHVRSGSSSLEIQEPRRLAPDVIDRLRFADGAPLPPSLRRWLAFDAAWLARATGLVAAVAAARLPARFLLDLVEEEWPEHDLAATFADLAAALPARGVLLDRDDTAFRALYLGSPDSHGEYPVLSIDIDDTPPMVSADHAGFDLWLAAMAGVPCRGPRRARELTECRRRLFGGAMVLHMLGPCPPLDRDDGRAPAADPAESAAERLVEAIGLGNRRRISAALAENAQHFPAGSWRSRAVIAAIHLLSDEILAEVLAAGGDPDTRCGDGTALALAAHLGAAGKVQLLLGAGADPNGIDDHGRLALDRAAAQGNAGVVRLLLDAGASTRALDRAGRDTLIAAASQDHHEVVALLLARGIDPDAPHDGEGGPLHHAVAHGRVDTVRLLLAHRASPDARNWCGDTPLHVAVKHDHADVARLLLEGGARRDLVNQDGWSVDSLIDARGHARREVSVTYRAHEKPQDLVIEIELLTWDRSRFTPELPFRMRGILAPLVAVAAAGGLGADRFDPSQSLAELLAAPRATLAPPQARHTLRWQLRVAGLAPSGLAVLLSPLLRPIHQTRVVRLTVTGSLPLDNSSDTVVVAGPDACARIAALAAGLRRWPAPPFAVEDEFAVEPALELTFSGAPARDTSAAIDELLRGWSLALPALPPREGEPQSRFVMVQAKKPRGATQRWVIQNPLADGTAGEFPFRREAALAIAIGVLSGAAARGADLTGVRLALPR